MTSVSLAATPLHGRGDLGDLASQYAAARPFPHIVIDGFLPPDLAIAAARSFPDTASPEWTRYRHLSSRKVGNTVRASFPAAIGELIDLLNADETVAAISRLTGIPGLIADASLEGGGMHQSHAGGYLDVHADFTAHRQHSNWRRRVNLLLYLNEEWRDDWCGHLELWDSTMSRCVQRIAPILNRCVIFTTDATSYHGHPIPMTCPPGTSRRSLALYYYTPEEAAFARRTTQYRSRPGDSPARRLLIRLNAAVLQGYQRVKRNRP